MRVAILTQSLRYNFGGILQNYALQVVLRRMGHEVVTLDPKRYIYPRWKYPILYFQHKIEKYFKGKSNILSNIKKDKHRRLYGKNTDRFIDKYIKRREYGNLCKDTREGEFDAFVVGSDQVWRPKYNCKKTLLGNMFLDFAQFWKVKRIAYAASFGTDEWEFTDEQTKECKKLVSLFDAVSVRENSGVSLCRERFEKEATHVLDPTLLLDRKDYLDCIKKGESIQGKEGNLYVYILDTTEENQRLINEFAQKRGLTPFTYNSKIFDNHHKYTLEEKVQLPVELWLKGFDQAQYVITDSFHACVFSIIFKKQFFLYGNKDRGMARYDSLFDMLGVGDRYVRNIEDLDNKDEIDYNQVYERLRCYQEISFEFLSSSLSGSTPVC